MGGAGLQGFVTCCYGDYTVLQWAVQGCRVTLPAAMATTLRCCGRGAGRQGFIACGYGDYAALPWVARGCRASLPAAMTTTLCC